MSLKAEFYRTLCDVARSDGGAAVLGRLVAQLEALLDALQAGDKERAEDLLADWHGKALLSQALLGWDRGSIDGGALQSGGNVVQ